MAVKASVLALCLLAPFPVYTEDTNPVPPTQPSAQFHIQAAPGLDVPLGESADYFSLGGSMALSFGYHLSAIPAISLIGEAGYGFDPLAAITSASVARAGAGLEAFVGITDRLGFGASITGGYYYARLNDSSLGDGGGGNPYASAAVRASLRIMPTLTLDIGTSYMNCFGLFSVLHPFFGTTITLGSGNSQWFESRIAKPIGSPASGSKASLIAVEDVKILDLFPVFYKYYDTHPIGSVTIRNKGTVPLRDVRLSTSIGKFMDAPKECATFPSLAAGESRTVEVYALLNDKVLEVTESTKVALEIRASYTTGQSTMEQTKVETLRIEDRNAMTWEDDKRVAAFVSNKDTAVLSFAKNVVGMVKGKGSQVVNDKLLTAMAIHETLSLYGLQYVPDPKTSYAEKSGTREVDSIQFPRHTLEYHAGDCDDLSILYCALLESIGIETAFITIPGHIYIAFSLGIDPQQSKRTFLKVEDLIFQGDTTWVPVEITQRTGGFLAAWQEGAREWREHTMRGQAGFISIHDAWKTYEPVGLPGTALTPSLPGSDKVIVAYLQEVVRFIDREISSSVSKYQLDMQKLGETPARLNQLGVLYAKYGLYDKAESQFKKAVAKEEHVPALINLGTIAYLQGDSEKAISLYDRAAKKSPNDSGVLLGLARANHSMENYGQVAKIYSKLKQVDPGLARRYAYLELKGDEATRAMDVSSMKGEARWSGDD